MDEVEYFVSYLYCPVTFSATETKAQSRIFLTGRILELVRKIFVLQRQMIILSKDKQNRQDMTLLCFSGVYTAKTRSDAFAFKEIPVIKKCSFLEKVLQLSMYLLLYICGV